MSNSVVETSVGSLRLNVVSEGQEDLRLPFYGTSASSPWPLLGVGPHCGLELEQEVFRLRRKAEAASSQHVACLQLHIDQLETDMLDKDTKLEIAENIKALSSDAEEVRLPAMKKADEQEAMYLLAEYGKKEAELKLDVLLASKIEGRSARWAAVKEKHQGDMKELVELGFQRFRDCYRHIVNLTLGVLLRLAICVR